MGVHGNGKADPAEDAGDDGGAAAGGMLVWGWVRSAEAFSLPAYRAGSREWTDAPAFAEAGKARNGLDKVPGTAFRSRDTTEQSMSPVDEVTISTPDAVDVMASMQ